MLGRHGSGRVQGGSIEGHALYIGDVAGEVGQAWAVCLVWVPPVLEELLEQRGLATLRKDGDLDRRGKSRMGLGSGPPEDRGLPAEDWGDSDTQSTRSGDTHPVPTPPHSNWTHPHRAAWLQDLPGSAWGSPSWR